jgi:hypothetical protein
MQCSEENFSNMFHPFAVADNNGCQTGYKLPSTYVEQWLWWPFRMFGLALLS